MISAVNVQDVSGLHHYMPRSFSEKAMLDAIHFLDPEDVLTMPTTSLPNLPNHDQLNRETIRVLKEANISYAYTRWGWAERFNGIPGGYITDKMAADWNAAMLRVQKIRTESYDDLGSKSSGGGFGNDPDLGEEI